jgi:hypothetical protein
MAEAEGLQAHKKCSFFAIKAIEEENKFDINNLVVETYQNEAVSFRDEFKDLM